MKNLILICFLFLVNVIFSQKNDVIKYGDILDFKVPEKYELRTNAYINEVKKDVLKELDFKSSLSQYVLQPKDMNDLNGRSNLYSRILVKVEHGNYESNQILIGYTKPDLENIEKHLIAEINKVPYIHIIKTSPVSVLKIKDKGFIDFSYTSKQGNEEAVNTRVVTYMDKNYLIRFSIIYRENEKNYWDSSIQDFLKSINIKN